MDRQEYLSRIPKVDNILSIPDTKKLLEKFPRNIVVEAIRTVLEELRQSISEAKEEELESITIDSENLIPIISKLVEKIMTPSLRKVINATGVIIHTNLGRAPLSEQALNSLSKISEGYSNLEYDLIKGERGDRQMHVKALLTTLTNAEDAMVVNNNAAAVLLALNSIAKDNEVIISRGQLVEIGGSFRIPDVISSSGAIIREVGTTNKTRLSDYQKAITDETATILRVHTSNYRIVGFAEQVSLSDLVKLGHQYNIPIMDDLGSGVLLELGVEGFEDEPTVKSSVEAGADVITFSGDKLLGGPQAGIILGKSELVEKMRTNPLARVLRVDKMILVALETTLRLYLNPKMARSQIPVIKMITCPIGKVARMSRSIEGRLKEELGNKCDIDIKKDYSKVGGGALPLLDLETRVVTLSPNTISSDKLALKLRSLSVPIIVRIDKDMLIIDPRTLLPGEDEIVVNSVKEAILSE
ncbi:MAG: L-seryl-tRNA(Sec) selenium transferase [Candidatus Humimicrobiia bacterium]